VWKHPAHAPYSREWRRKGGYDRRGGGNGEATREGGGGNGEEREAMREGEEGMEKKREGNGEESERRGRREWRRKGGYDRRGGGNGEEREATRVGGGGNGEEREATREGGGGNGEEREDANGYIQYCLFLQMGAYHTIDLQLNHKFTLAKQCWDYVSFDRLGIYSLSAGLAA
jgi:hypothetical protein